MYTSAGCASSECALYCVLLKKRHSAEYCAALAQSNLYRSKSLSSGTRIPELRPNRTDANRPTPNVRNRSTRFRASSCLGTQSLLLFLNRRPVRPLRSSPSAPLRYEPIASLLGRAIERAHDPLAILVLIVRSRVCVSPRARAVWQPEALVIGCCLMSAEYE